MCISQFEIICKKVVNLFNFQSREYARRVFERFTNIQDLFKYVRIYNFGIDIIIYDLISIL